MTARIAGLPLQSASPETRAIFDRVEAKYGSLLEPISVAANHPEVFAAYTSYERCFGAAGRIELKIKELAILKVASIIGCPFCIDLGSAQAKKSGITEAQMRALSVYRVGTAFSNTEMLVLDYAVAMTANPVEVPDSLFAQLLEVFNSAQIIELTASIAWENYRSRFNHALGMQSHGFAEQTYCTISEEIPNQ